MGSYDDFPHILYVLADIFEANDLDRTGMVTVNQFKQIVSKLQLLQSEVQLSKAVEDCLSLSNKLVRWDGMENI